MGDGRPEREGGGSPVSQELRRVDRLRRAGSLEQALGMLRALVDAHSGDARLHYELGLTLAVWGGAPADAMPHFDRAIALGPNLRSAHLQRALALGRLGRHAEALAELDGLEVARYRNALMLYTLRAESHEALGHLAEAERDWSGALRHDATNPWLLERRAAARTSLGRLEEARADLDLALEHQRRDEARLDLDLLRQRAQVRARLGDREGARGDLTEAFAEAEARQDAALAEVLRRELAGLG
jgi:tetratricopeptide (TPR) repeat protein